MSHNVKPAQPLLDGLAAYTRSVLQALPPSVQRTAILGGGALRSFLDATPVKDYDIFFRTHKDYQDACADMVLNGYTVDYSSPNAAVIHVFTTPCPPFNFVGFRHMAPQQLVESFDFTCCSIVAYIDERDEVQVLYHPEALFDAQHKQLRLSGPRPAKSALKRISRYAGQYGYEITDDLVARFKDCFDVRPEGDEPDFSSGG